MAARREIIVIPDGKISDYIDGTFRDDTPEEYVRQTIEKRLVNELKYDPAQIRVEYALQIGARKPRADIVVWDADAPKQTQETIKIIIECKRESIPASSAKDGVAQLQSYMSVCPNCEWGMWTNSVEKIVLRKYADESGAVRFMDYNDIPSAGGSLEDVDRPKRAGLRDASDNNLLFVFRTCHNHIYVNDGLQKQPAFFELLKLIFCKIEDEHNIPAPLEFYAASGERNSPDGQLTVKKRISQIFDRVKARYDKIFDANDELKLTPRSLAHIVSELQQYSLLKTNIDIKGKAYEEIVGANLRGDRGEFFTPRNVMKMTVEMVSPKAGERVLDSSCGTGGFLVLAMTHASGQLEEAFAKDLGAPRAEWRADDEKIYHERVKDLASTCYFGFDINPDLVKATKMNMVMNNDGSGNIFQVKSLLPPHMWPEDFRRDLASALKIDPSALRNHETIGYFDVIVTNPPFGSKSPIRDRYILEQFELAHIWKNEGGRWRRTEKLQTSAPPEILFVERCTQFLREGGRMGIVLPDSILGSPGLGYIREWLIRNHRIVASIDLHADTFQPRNGTQTSVLFLQKKSQAQKDKEEKSGLIGNYNIFMAMVEKVGHDKRGNPLFKRDEYGNEILAPDKTAGGASGGAHERLKKIPDDQTGDVAAAFAVWKKQGGIAW